MVQENPAMSLSNPEDSLFIQSLARGMSVLEAFREADGPLSLAQIAAKAKEKARARRG